MEVNDEYNRAIDALNKYVPDKRTARKIIQQCSLYNFPIARNRDIALKDDEDFKKANALCIVNTVKSYVNSDLFEEKIKGIREEGTKELDELTDNFLRGDLTEKVSESVKSYSEQFGKIFKGKPTPMTRLANIFKTKKTKEKELKAKKEKEQEEAKKKVIVEREARLKALKEEKEIAKLEKELGKEPSKVKAEAEVKEKVPTIPKEEIKKGITDIKKAVPWTSSTIVAVVLIITFILIVMTIGMVVTIIGGLWAIALMLKKNPNVTGVARTYLIMYAVSMNWIYVIYHGIKYGFSSLAP
jgi:hypothetical protein